jgi:hypothetical protein
MELTSILMLFIIKRLWKIPLQIRFKNTFQDCILCWWFIVHACKIRNENMTWGMGSRYHIAWKTLLNNHTQRLLAYIFTDVYNEEYIKTHAFISYCCNVFPCLMKRFFLWREIYTNMTRHVHFRTSNTIKQK